MEKLVESLSSGPIDVSEPILAQDRGKHATPYGLQHEKDSHRTTYWRLLCCGVPRGMRSSAHM